MLWAVLLVLVVFGGVAIAGATWTAKRLDSSVERVADAFPEGDRPAPSGGTTFLVVGRDPASQTVRNSVVDSVMLFHVSGSRTEAQTVYLPVHPQLEVGGSSLDQVYGQGGPSSLVGTVEELTGLRVDHYAEVDFQGFATATDALGGVDIDVPEPFSSGGYDFESGRQHLDGAAALAFVRDDGVGGELGSAQRQQTLLTALFERVGQLGVLSDLRRLTATVGTMIRSIRVDDTVTDTQLIQVLWSLRKLDEPAFVTVPLSVPPVEDGGQTATYDPRRAADLWRYLREDSLHKHLEEFE